MTDLNMAVTDTSAYEGYRMSPYKDSRGLWTVGEGTCLETNPINGKDWKYLLDNGMVTMNISGAGARWLLRGKTAAELADLATRYPGFAALPDLAQTLLLEMAYQLGTDGVLGLTTFNKLVGTRQWAAAARDGRGTAWYKETPERAEKILAQLEGIVP
jgi:lysozyme